MPPTTQDVGSRGPRRGTDWAAIPAYNADGAAEAGMGIAFGDVDRVKIEIEQILEGGAEAFLERKRRYGH